MAKSGLTRARSRISRPRNISMCRRGAEDDASAEGPAIHEAGLARFCEPRSWVRRRTPVLQRMSSAQCRTAWRLACSAHINGRHEAFARYAQEPMFDDEIRAAVVDDIRRVYAGMREQLALYDFSVLHGLPTPLLIGDTPFIDWRVRASPALPFVSLPLGPYCLLVGAPSGRKSRIAPVVWRRCRDAPVEGSQPPNRGAGVVGWWRPRTTNSSLRKVALPRPSAPGKGM